jgi:PAS domain-containing protein
MSPGPVCQPDRTGRVQLANRAARNLFDTHDLVGKDRLRLCPGMDAEQWRRILEEDQPTIQEAEISTVVIQFTYVPA